MAQEKESKKETPKVKKVVTIVDVTKQLGLIGGTDREDLGKKVFAKMKSLNISKNIRGRPLLEENVIGQIGAIIRDITSERHGWWQTYKVVETETSLKIMPK